MKNTIILFYVVVVAVMATATILEKYQGTQYVTDNIYGAWWFSLLWALLAAAGVCWFVKRRVRRFGTVVLHLSFVVILLGALLTHLTARHGVVHIREGETTNNYLTQDMHVHTLPFSVRLDRFEITYHEGTMAPADFASHITFIPHGDAPSGTTAAAVTTRRCLRVFAFILRFHDVVGVFLFNVVHSGIGFFDLVIVIKLDIVH